MSISSRQLVKKLTYADYLTWPDDERWEIIDGVAYQMTAAPSSDHQRVCARLAGEFYAFFKDKTCEVFFAPFDVRLPVGNETDAEIETVVQPDILIICDKSQLTERGSKGSPSLVVEVISPSTARKDTVDKFYLYERVAVKEYWIVRPEEKTVMVFTLGSDNRYGRPEIYSGTDVIRTRLFDGLAIEVDGVFKE